MSIPKKSTTGGQSPVKDPNQTKGGLVLQKQLPASAIPRFNPHGPQAPPQLKEPEYQSPKRVMNKSKSHMSEESTDFSKYNIEDLLLNEGVEFRNPQKAEGGWLPLEAYDDKEFDAKRPADWLKRAKNIDPVTQSVGAQGLWKDKDGLCYWRKCRIQKYLKSERYEGYWENTKEKCRLYRIFLLFDEEDPRIFAKRFKKAYMSRIYADSMIRYNYYIENMPTHQIPEVDNEQVNRVLSLTQNTKALRGKSSSDTTTLLSEVNFDFAKSMNKIIFDKHMRDKNNDLIMSNLTLPPNPPAKEKPYYGLINIPPHNFPEQFSQFCFNTMLNKDEVIKAMQIIRKQCNDAGLRSIYNTSITHTMTVRDFEGSQNGSITSTTTQLKNQWGEAIKTAIQDNFREQPGAVKSWYNLNETNKEAYEAGKLKKFLTQVKMMMQDTLLAITKRSVNQFVEEVLKFLPKEVRIIDSNNVENEFFTKEEKEANDQLKIPFPLFQIELTTDQVTNEPRYSSTPAEISQVIQTIFDKGINNLKDIPSPEQKLLPHLFKSNVKSYLKATVRPLYKPEDPDPKDKRALPDENAWIYDLYHTLTHRFDEAVEPLNQYIKTYAKYDKEYKIDPVAIIKKLDDDENPPEIDFLRKDVIFHQKEADRLKGEIPDEIVVSMFRVSCKEIRNKLVEKHLKIAKDEIDLIAKRAKMAGNELLANFEKITAKIESHPKDIEELTALKDYMASVPNEIEKLQKDIKDTLGVYEILNQFNYKFPNDADFDKKWEVFGAPKETASKIEKQLNILQVLQDKYLNQMVGNMEEFEKTINEIIDQVTQFQKYQDISQYEEVSQIAKSIHTKINQAQDQAKTFNNRQMLTGQDPTDYTKITEEAKKFQPFYNLWTTLENWKTSHKSWLHDPFEELDAAKLEETVDAANKTMAQVIRFFRDKEMPGIMKIADQTKQDIDEFKPYVPLALALRTEGMKERHWNVISDKVGFEVKPFEGFTFNNCIEMDLLKHVEICCDIGEKAGKEFNIETSMAKMKKDWEGVEFKLKPFKNTGTYSVAGFDDAMAMLDEHIVLTQTMQFSPFKKPFEAEIEEWNASLLRVSECIDEWIKCQGQWMYLQPIFDSPDIMKQLPSENKKFKNVDKNWREVINGTKANPNILKSCTREGLLEKFQDANKNLDLVQRGLREYLESKRSVFARFYFLSNDELLEILSQTKEVENVRPHLRKVFENMADLEFKPDKTIIAMYSGEREKIQFAETVDPREKGVEYWMGEIERMMFKSVRAVLLHSVEDYLVKNRNEWILVHPGQCVLNGSQVHWTTEVEDSIKKEGVEGLDKYFKKLDEQLLQTVQLVRRKLTNLQSTTLGALIVIDVHAKDVIDNLRASKIDDINAFEWISQLRYYWENDNCRVKCIQTDFPYGYEYLGNTLRLVITPLTDKCYMTLMGALKLNLGGAPAGPAGTGKTESTKDLAKALAMQCVVFNCSDSMDYIMLGKFFKGLSAAGAWACFDEFNRINIEVLSVIAQQLLILFGAKGRMETELMFEESLIKMKQTFCVFITMNPGYAGRSELPDNLKALFRPVAMMVPDYSLIGQIRLYSFGYTKALILAKKMVTTFKLASEQLSSQDHYDYGMRAVTSVINAAGLLKRADPDMNEDQLLLRALRDVNVPKFLKDDLPLFENIISDLFPGVQKPNIDYGSLLEMIKKSSHVKNLQPTQPFIDKIIQLYDTIQVRHGLMLVGPTGGGKTSNYKTLAHAMTQLNGMDKFAIVHYHILNPKSILMSQLYGDVDKQTSEWVDGVLAKIMQECVKDETRDKQWIMFDGPVDAIWIENMNTVLDDNKKLCLNSGQIIPLTDRMTMMFEVEDLAVASPATVSRCGMVYMEPGALGLDPLIKSWINTIPPGFKTKKTFVPHLENQFKKYLENGIHFMRKNCIEPVQTVNNNITQSLMRILDCYFIDYFDTEVKKVTPEEIEDMENMLEALFQFAFIWSIGATTNLEGRERFSNKMRELMGKDSKYKIPAEGLVYDYCFNREKKEWVYWINTVPAYSVDNRMGYGEIVVPTLDSIRMKYLKRILVMNKKHVLSPGPTGTGKTVNINQLLSAELSEDYQTIPLTFSAQTSANQTQFALDEKFDKRRKGVFGPPPGKRFVIFVDDLNMPKKEEYGAQPPIELLRQWMDHQGWYDLKSKEKPFMKIEDIILICAMGPPGGGRSPLTKRLERHFNIITYTNLGKDSITQIFSKIIVAFLAGFSEAIAKSLDNIVEATQRVYAAVAANLKPTPSKSHYTFNLRDMSKIFQGLCSAQQKTTQQPVELIRMWIHENKRVFGDRMISQEDRDTLDGLLNDEALNTFKLTRDQIYVTERIIFGDYINGIDGDQKPYIWIQDLKDLVKKVEGYLEDFNSGQKNPMKLILFLDACDHVSRICRILRAPQGNAFLLGVGGSGRQSLAKLSSYMSNQKCFQIEVVKGYSMTNWRDNLKTCLMQAGVEGKPTTFLFCDTQIINEQMVEDINNILNSGDVAGLYKNEDFEGIYMVGKGECIRKNIPLNKMNMFSCYLGRVKQNIHIVLAFSPLGDVFRTRLRMFPSLVNCCTIDWFTEWPEEALMNVAKGIIADGDMNLGADEDLCVDMFKIMHQSVEHKSKKFLDELRRRNYVTPTSYLELLNTYKSVLSERKKFFGDARRRLERGLEVLYEAAIEVANLREMLEKKGPELQKTQIEVANTKLVIEKESVEANEIKVVVSAEEIEAAAQEAEVSKIKGDADADLAVAIPALENAVKKVREINVNDFYELKAVNTPGPSIVACFQVVCFLLLTGEKPKKPNDPKKIQFDPEGWFEMSKQKLLSEPKKFLNDMINYDKDHIPDSLIAKIKPMMEKEELSEAKIKNASGALVAVRVWILAMITYHEVLKIVNPKRAIAAEMGAKLAIVQSALAEKQAKVRAINAKLEKLQNQMDALIKQEKELAADIDDCNKKLVRAEKMIGGLEGEKVRWTDTVKTLGEKIQLLVGDCLVAAGMVSYAGPFTASFRAELEDEWRKSIKKIGLKSTNNITMRQVLGDDVIIRIWSVAGLPNDNLSVENGIILFKSRRWPLMIDPQTQANKFIKNMGKTVETGLDIFKPSEGNLLRNLELAIQFGKWVLLENIGEELDPALEPILLQQKVKQGSGYVIKIGDKTISYNESFKFFLTTTLPNPHYSPETSVKVTILNFAITPAGLEEQMLNQLVQLEMPDLQEKKNQIVEQNAQSAKQLRDIEDMILMELDGNTVAQLLETDKLIDILAESKKTSEQIGIRMKESEITEKEIDSTRESFRPVAYRASLLFFCIFDLALIDPMYQYSLQWFQNLFGNSVTNSNPSNDVNERILILNNYFTYSLYQNVCRSLFEKDKLLFSFLLTTKILFGDNQIDMDEWRYLLAGPSGTIEVLPNPTDWLDDLEWNQVYRQLYCMAKLPAFAGIDAYFMEFSKKFKRIFDAPEAHEEPLPGEWNEKLNSFQKMIVLKSIRADKICQAIQNYVIEKIGKQFVDPPTFKIQPCYKDSSNISPLIFVLSAGTDPVKDFKTFAEEEGMWAKTEMISLGQGQGKKAEKLIDEAKVKGNWVLLQNCHLSLSWMPRLESIVESFTRTNHQEFRLWLTSMPSEAFPVSTLQNSVKMTLEPPQGLRSNLLRTYDVLDNKLLNDCNKPREYKMLLLGFAFFHAIVQDRRKFGPIGWNIPYAFTFEDFDVCQKQLKLFLDDYEVIPFKVLNYLGSEINYGGRVTDDKDVRLIKSILKRYINEGIVTDNYKFSKSGLYYSVVANSQEDYMSYIRELPLNPKPEVFGLHDNAEITNNQSMTIQILDSIISIQPKSSSAGGKTRDQIIMEISQELASKTPLPFDYDMVTEKFPTEYTESMNTVLTQEVIRYNKLLVIMAEMLVNVQKAVKGEVVMSEDLDKMATSLFNNQVPARWAPNVGFLSLKPLASWTQDLNDRINFLKKWIEGGTPTVFWLSGLFFPQAFFTGCLQNYARKHVIAIDELDFDVKIYDEISYNEVTEKPEDGCYTYGLYLEGARWNSTTHYLDESKPKQLYTELPMIWFLPKKNRKKPTSGIYNCPVYKVLSRAGTLSTTGHSTNFVMMLELPSKEEEDYWINAGVAAFLALRY